MDMPSVREKKLWATGWQEAGTSFSRHSREAPLREKRRESKAPLFLRRREQFARHQGKEKKCEAIIILILTREKEIPSLGKEEEGAKTARRKRNKFEQGRRRSALLSRGKRRYFLGLKRGRGGFCAWVERGPFSGGMEG